MNPEVCPLCQGKGHERIQVKEMVYSHCRTCDLIFLHDPYLLSKEKEKERYDQHNNSLENQGYVDMLLRFLEATVLPFQTPPGNALDFGSGPEPVLKVLLERQGYVTNIYDPFYAPEKVYEGRQYDLVTCTETLEHIYNPQDAWRLFSQIVKPGGILALMTLFHSTAEDFASWWYRRDRTHIRFYSLKTFQWITEHYPFSMLWHNARNQVTLKRRV